MKTSQEYLEKAQEVLTTKPETWEEYGYRTDRARVYVELALAVDKIGR